MVGSALDFVRPCYYIAYNLLNIYNLLRVRQRMNKEKRTLPLLALRDVIIFPSTIAPVFIGREKSLNALLSAKKIEDGQHILLTTQKKQNIEDPNANDLFKIGVLAKIVQTVKLPNNNAKILVEVMNRVKLSNIEDNEIFVADYTILPDAEITDLERLNQTTTELLELFQEYVRNNKKINLEVLNILNQQKNPGYITNLIASHLESNLDVKQNLLEQVDILKKAEMLIEIITKESMQSETEHSVQQRVKKQIEKTQREFYLNEQMKAIQQEMEGGSDKSDFFEKELLSWWKDEWVPSKIYIEKAAMMFTPGMSSAQTIMTLGRFNGIISNILYKKFGIKPTMLGVTSARSKLGIKIDRKDKSKTTKDKVFEIVKTMHPEFPWITHIAKNGKFKDQLVYDKENYDMCDAFVIVAGGRLLA